MAEEGASGLQFVRVLVDARFHCLTGGRLVPAGHALAHVHASGRERERERDRIRDPLRAAWANAPPYYCSC